MKRAATLANPMNWMVLGVQTSAVLSALVIAWLLRFDFSLPQRQLLFLAAPILVLSRGVGIYRYRLTHAYWRYTGIGDLEDLLKGLLLGSLVFIALVRWVCGIVAFPLSIYVLEGMLSFLLLAGMRIGARVVLQARNARTAGEKIPVLIVGAGAAASLLLRELHRLNFSVIGLLDDNPAKHNIKIGGVTVLDTIDQLPFLVDRFAIREVFIAIPSATGAQMLRITDLCVRSGARFRALPALADLIDGKVTISSLRDVNVDELLDREPVRLETDNVLANLSDRVVMVTGAAGSIGAELCRQIVRFRPKRLICVDQAETPLFNLQQHTLADSHTVELIYSVTDIADSERMRQLLSKHNVNVIFHAAAYKHVPMTEANPYEALRNNVFGLFELVETAELCGCEEFVLISSDKAVDPSSLMGCTKRLGEMIVGLRECSRMRCVSVRFGNVLGSQGSVIPLFQEQIRSGRFITVTHPDMTRYFMTIPEAVSLVLQAFTVGEHGDVLVLDMGKPVRILELAKTLIRLSGKRESDVPIVYTGIRPGEKLHEKLFYDSEIRSFTTLAKVIRAQGRLPDWQIFKRQLQELRLAVSSQDGERIRAKVKQIIPEYQWEPTLPEMLPPPPAFASPSSVSANLRSQSKYA